MKRPAVTGEMREITVGAIRGYKKEFLLCAVATLPTLAHGATMDGCTLQNGYSWRPALTDDVASTSLACPSWPNGRGHCAERDVYNFHPGGGKSCDRHWWRPAALNYENFARVLDGRTIRLIGDSVSGDHYGYLTRCVLNCSFTEAQTGNMGLLNTKKRREWADELAAAGHEPDAIEWSLKHLMSVSAKGQYAAGCAVGRGRIDYRRVNNLPGIERWSKHNTTHEKVLAACMHILLYTPESRRLTPRDVVLMNFGLHQPHKLRAQVNGMLQWWRKAAVNSHLPRLLWRQTSPQHWPLAPSGQFRSFSDVGATRSRPCRGVPSILGNQRTAALALYDRNVTADVIDLAQQLEHKPHHTRADVLHVFTASWERSEDHPILRPGALSLSAAQISKFARNDSLADCTHFCIPGSTYRFWSQALLAWLAR